MPRIQVVDDFLQWLWVTTNIHPVYLFLIVLFFFAAVVYFSKRPKDRDYAQDLVERIQASLPPLQPGALFTAAITPFENNTIQFAVRLSPEAQEIIARQNLSSVRIFDYPNPYYEEGKREQARLKASHRFKDQVAAQYETPKNIDVTVKDFCSPSGIIRAFPSAAEAKEWTTQLRQGLNILESILEANEKPAEAETFTVMRKS